MIAKLSILVPVHNEEKTVREVVEEMCALDLGKIEKEVILVDDGSTDGTAAKLAELAVRHPGLVRVFTSSVRQGKGAAVRRGFIECRGDVILIHDGDRELVPSEVPRVVEPFLLDGIEVVYGSRFLAASSSGSRLNFIANRFLTSLTNVLFGARLTDMETACKAFRRDVVLGLDLKAVGFEIEPEVTAKLLKAGYAIREVPISYHPRSHAEGKKVSWRDGLVAIYTLVRCRLAP